MSHAPATYNTENPLYRWGLMLASDACRFLRVGRAALRELADTRQIAVVTVMGHRRFPAASLSEYWHPGTLADQPEPQPFNVPHPQDRLGALSTKETMQFLRIGREEFQALTHAGVFDRVTSAHRSKFPIVSLEAYINSVCTPASRPGAAHTPHPQED